MLIGGNKFYIADAFSDKLFGGNPAGVVLFDEGEDFPDSERMRQIAAELRYSETAFVKMLGKGRFRTRYFTPAAEVELCGHATVAAFSALREAEVLCAGEICTNETLAGELCVEVGESAVWMEMGAPRLLESIEGQELAELCAIMGIRRSPDAPVRKVSTGLPDIMLPAGSEAALAALNPDFFALSKFSERHGVVGVHAFAHSNRDGNYHVRNFAPLYGIDEEAATGTANAALLYYLYELGSAAAGRTYTVVQGEKMGRQSEIYVRVEQKPESAARQSGERNSGRGVAVKVGGAAAILAQGRIYV